MFVENRAVYNCEMSIYHGRKDEPGIKSCYSAERRPAPGMDGYPGCHLKKYPAVTERNP